jgi:hypothetical protein
MAATTRVVRGDTTAELLAGAARTYGAAMGVLGLSESTAPAGTLTITFKFEVLEVPV